ncbi:MAG: M23 family metallopeptidase [Oscillospiraceae bacterium]|nr:M23 family metallopeptidase [Oscillospiraceae bacterium]
MVKRNYTLCRTKRKDVIAYSEPILESKYRFRRSKERVDLEAYRIFYENRNFWVEVEILKNAAYILYKDVEFGLEEQEKFDRMVKEHERRLVEYERNNPSRANPTASNINTGHLFRCTCDVHNGSHSGVDYAGVRGDPIYSAISGNAVIIKSGAVNNKNNTSDPGNYVQVISEDNTTVTQYLHLNTITIQNNQKVQAGTQIGTMGDTGYSFGVHLHFGVMIKGVAVDPIKFLEGTL